RSRHDFNGGEFCVVNICCSDDVEHSVCDRDDEASPDRGKLSGYRPDIKVLQNNLTFQTDTKHTLPGRVEIYFSKVESDRIRAVNDWDVVRERWRITFRLIQRWVRCSGNQLSSRKSHTVDKIHVDRPWSACAVQIRWPTAINSYRRRCRRRRR